MRKNKLCFDQDICIQFVKTKSKDFSLVDKVFLFGSRVTGNDNSKSDYDLAFDVNVNDKSLELQWGRLCSELREKNPKLNQLDLIRLDLVKPDLLKKIKKEGFLIYEKTKTKFS